MTRRRQRLQRPPPLVSLPPRPRRPASASSSLPTFFPCLSFLPSTTHINSASSRSQHSFPLIQLPLPRAGLDTFRICISTPHCACANPPTRRNYGCHHLC